MTKPIFIVGGSKGGVGKSTTSVSLLIESGHVQP